MNALSAEALRKAFAEARPDMPLIVDVGANNGDDSDFYLRKGFRVFAIEADPDLVCDLRDRFAHQIGQGRYLVENAAITDQREPVVFYKNEFSEWSSTKDNTKATQANTFRTIEVPGDTLGHLLAPFLAIRYIKIDIEGCELEGIASLGDLASRVNYISFEINSDWQKVMAQLSEYGFGRFQLVRQGRDHLPRPPHPPREGGYVDTVFKNSMSGTFGEELPGEWIEHDEMVKAVWRCFKERRERVAQGQPSGWHDIHAMRRA